ncbi:hypothetical protein [Streptomyces antibioticus]|uniref:hypothetical protein n=1 Tax=Streptomyces antibioticus TaxID=1890 RepID=UPI0033EFCD8E
MPIVGAALVPKPAAHRPADPRPVIGSGPALIGLGLLAVSTAGPGTPYPLYASRLLAVPAGTGRSMPALIVGVVAALPARQAGLGPGLGTSARKIGAALAVAVAGTVLAGHGGLGTGTGPALRTVGAVVLAATVAVVAGPRDPAPGAERDMPTDPVPEESGAGPVR